jgi:hypothetical protein
MAEPATALRVRLEPAGSSRRGRFVWFRPPPDDPLVGDWSSLSVRADALGGRKLRVSILVEADEP